MAALARCVGDPELFAAELWGRTPLHRSGAEGGGFDDLLSLDDVDRIVSSMGIRLPAFRLVRDGKTLPAPYYTKTTRTGSEAAAGVLDAAAVFREFEAGATIVFQGMHRYWEPLGMFCRQLEQALGHPVQANAYVTPPGSQGFDAHEDKHDVFVLQSHGAKDWRVYERHDLPPRLVPLIDAAIRPGDSLYIPSGFPHAASTQEDASVHVTIGILSITWGTALGEAVKLAKESALLSEPLPLRFAERPDELRVVVEEHLAELGALIAKVDSVEMAERLRRKFLTTRQPVLRGQTHRLLSLDAVSDESVVRKRAGAMCVLSTEDGELSVLLGDRELRMPEWLEPAMRMIADHDELEVSTLAPHLDEPGRLVLARRLVREGLLEVVD